MGGVTLSNLSKAFAGGRQAVCELSLDVAEGELLALVGPSGCGKTTTLRMIAGLEAPTAGEIRISGRRVNELQPAERDVAMVFQSDALYPHMTVRQNLAFGLKLRGTTRAETERRIAEAAAALGLGEQLERRPAELSGGERQRVALGRALVREPQVFLFDEPLSNLDARVRADLREVIAGLHRRLRATMIYVTHDQAEAMLLGERIAVMNAGTVLQVAAPLEVYRRPADCFVAGFVGSPRMNLLRGEIDGAGTFRHATGQIEIAATARGRVVLGVRAEDVAPNGDGPRLGPAVVDAVESLGDAAWGYFELGGTRVAMRVPSGNGLKAGDAIEPRLRRGAWMLFADDATGRRVEE